MQPTITWHDAATLDVEGRAWDNPAAPWTRLPERAKGVVPDSVWQLSRHSAGITVRFACDTPTLRVRWTLADTALAMPHMPATGVSGVDLYVRDPRGAWRFVQNGRPGGADNETTVALPAGKPAECLLHLPLYNGATSVQIGIAPPGRLLPKPAPRRRPLAVYGTSIAQGGCASRPGMAWPAILGRHLDRPAINLGFSGSGRMEASVAALLAEVDPALWIVDCLWNCGGLPDGELERRVEHLVRTLRAARPHAPLLLVGQSHLQPDVHPTALSRRQEAVVRRLQAEGLPNLHLAPGRHLIGDDAEGTVDGVHPNDLGMQRQADALHPLVARLLRGRP